MTLLGWTRTTLVLGAGASMPVGLPSGAELTRNLITTLASRWPPLCQMFPEQRVNEFAAAFAFSDQRSIDAFLEHRPEFLDIGKAAIACALLPAERLNRLFPNEPDSANWYRYLLDKLPPKLEGLGEHLSIVTFNYDRTLEAYLFTALKNRHKLSDHDAAQAVDRIPILHVYGSFGRLPFQYHDPEVYVEFGGGPGGTQLDPTVVARAAGNLRIIAERSEPTEELQRAQFAISHAKRVYFLGFAYDRLNLRRLVVDPAPHTQFTGTAYGMTEREAEVVQNYLGNLGCVDVRPLELGNDADTLKYLRKHCPFDA